MGRSAINRVLCVVVVSLGTSSALASDQPDLRSDIERSIQDRDHVEAARLLDLHLLDHPGDGLMHYHAARINSQLGNLEQADRHLLDAVRGDYQNFSMMKRASDLDPIRNRGMYRTLMAARNAADDLLAGRRIDHWLSRLPDGYRHESGNQMPLDIVSRLTPDEVIELVTEIDGLAGRLRAELFESLPTLRVTLVILEEEDADSFLPSTNARGHYHHPSRQLVVVGTGRELRHELVHVMHHAQMDHLGQQHPIWVQEGLATLFEAYRIEDARLRFLANDSDRFARRLAMDDNMIALPQLLEMPKQDFNAQARVTYPQARSLFELLAESGDLGLWYQRYCANYDDDPTGQAGVESMLGLDLASIEELWLDWLVAREPEYIAPGGGSVLVRRARPFRAHPNPEPDEDEELSTEPLERNNASQQAAQRFTEAHPQRLDEYADRIDELQQVVSLDAGHASAHYDLGLAYLWRGDVARARSEYDKLLPLDRNLANMLGALLDARTRKAG